MLKHLSTTFIGNFVLCPRRAWRSYLRRNELGNDNEGTEPTRFGNVAHNTLEYIHEQLTCGAIAEEDVTDQYVDGVFNRYWQTGGCYDFDYYTLGRDKMGEFVRRSIFNRRGRTVSTELTFVIDLESLEVFIDPIDLNATVENIKEQGHTPVSSKIDRIDIVDGEDGEYEVEVYDYKTNMLPFTRAEIEESKQLGIYGLVAQSIYPDATQITCIYDMVRHGRFPVTFPNEFLNYLRDFLINLYKQAEDTQDEERLNKYCKWCEIRSKCNTYSEALMSEIPTVATDGEDLEARYEELDQLQLRSKVIDARIDEIKEIFGSRIVNDTQGGPLKISDTKEVYLLSSSRRKYDTAGVFEVLKRFKSLVLMKDIATINIANLERVVKSRDKIKEALEPHISLSYTKPSLKVRALKAGSCTNEQETSE